MLRYRTAIISVLLWPAQARMYRRWFRVVFHPPTWVLGYLLRGHLAESINGHFGARAFHHAGY